MSGAPVLVAWFFLAVLALGGTVADVMALRADTRRAMPATALGIKVAVALAFVLYFVALRVGAFSGWQDLTTFASILVLSIAALGLALVLDVVLIVRLVRRGTSG